MQMGSMAIAQREEMTAEHAASAMLQEAKDMTIPKTTIAQLQPVTQMAAG